MHAITNLIQALTSSLSWAGGMNTHSGLVTGGSLSSSQHYADDAESPTDPLPGGASLP